jgi:hypothetical protein
MKGKNLILAIVLIAASTFVFTACSKKDDNTAGDVAIDTTTEGESEIASGNNDYDFATVETNTVISLNLGTYSSFSEIVSANPRAGWELYDGFDPSSINLNKVPSILGTQFNVFVEEGLEETWGKLKSAYNLNPPDDWVLTGLSQDEILGNFALGRNMDNARILFVTRAHDDFFSIFKQDWAVFVQDPKGILKKK